MKYRRPLAIAGIAVIVVCYVSTIYFALSSSPKAPNMLMASMFTTIVVPVVLYAYQVILKAVGKRKDQEDSVQ